MYPYMECQMFTQCNRDINRQIYGPSLLSVNECVAHKRDVRKPMSCCTRAERHMSFLKRMWD